MNRSIFIFLAMSMALVSCKKDDVAVSGVTLDQSVLRLNVGDRFTLTATVEPANANRDVAWTSSDEKTVTVKKGENGTATVTAASAGMATVFVTTVDGGFGRGCSITVTDKVISVSGVSIEPSEAVIAGIGNTEKLTATVTPANATNQTIFWQSSNTDIATVAQDGTVTAIGAGTADIFAIASDGELMATCKLRVLVENAATSQQFATNIRNYLDAAFTSFITEVNAGATTVDVTGYCTGDGNFALCEIPPFLNVTQFDYFPYTRPLTAAAFTETFDRYVERNGFMYDRTLSKWLIVRKNEGNKDEMVSHARYPDNIHASQSMTQQKPLSKKGLGGFINHPLQRQDLENLGITSATVNLYATSYMRSRQVGNMIEHRYGGQSYYFDRGSVEEMDAILKECAARSVVVAAIVLLAPASQCPDIEIGNLLQHPDYSRGHFTMPNMSNPASVNAYAAMLDFFAARYCRPNNLYGRIHHWIMHNEVDVAYEWTNMGANKPLLSCVDAYMKSMRLCYNIVRRYDTYSEVFASFTHSWTQAEYVSYSYPTLGFLRALNDYCRAEGDFQWAVAYHSYPQSLLEPKTWLDANATYSTATPFVTFKNLEVLHHWAMQPENRYRSTAKRSVWLSENGTNSKSYSENDLREQAAGFAWAWKKLKQLDGIDAMQWHNWFDHPDEAPLRIGLRKDESTGFEPKEVWYAYQAAGTANEDNFFQKYLSVIGITDWNMIQNVNN